MTLALTPNPELRVYDNAGNLAINGSVYTYAAGTTTPQAAYTDSTGATQLSNPVVLNSRGEASIWLSPGVAYKLVAYDQSGNLLWSQDNVYGPTSGALGNLTGGFSLGAGTTTFLNASQTGNIVQMNGGTLYLPNSATLQNGATFYIWSGNPSSLIVCQGSDKIYQGGLGSVTLNSGDFITLTLETANTWVVLSGSTSLGNTAAFGSSLAGAGYQKFPGGLIIQWGNIIVSTLTAITFPVAFPSSVFSMTISNGGNGTPSNCTLDTTALSLTGTTASSFTGSTGAASTRSCFWIAVGK